MYAKYTGKIIHLIYYYFKKIMREFKDFLFNNNIMLQNILYFIFYSISQNMKLNKALFCNLCINILILKVCCSDNISHIVSRIINKKYLY